MKITTVFSSLNLMHKGMLMGQVIFTAVMFFLVYKKMLDPVAAKHEKILQLVAIVFAAVAILLGNSIFKKKLVWINQHSSLDAKTKLEMYRSATFLHWGLAEAGCLVSGICFLLSGNYAFLALAAVLVVYFAMLMPVKTRIAAQLNLQTSDLNEL